MTLDELRELKARRKRLGIPEEPDALPEEVEAKIPERPEEIDPAWIRDRLLEARAPLLAERDRLRALLERRAQEAEAENRILRGLVQTNPDWKCPYGEPVDCIGKCSLGFPGCACADDRIAVLCEDGDAGRDRLRALLERREEEIAALGGRRCENCGGINHARPPGARGRRRTVLDHCSDCDWPLGTPAPDEPLCSICRRRHPSDDRHACE